ncbi:M48 family metallopeptidase [Flavihumibacter rivuli]|uniref:M48 family metalloprotease n=1 Tax=Flavihumibacter rivuli TaxID=2838156 RepID=UPI001BDE20DA|nr:M48 family metallopeptidase [Flavihumibacter rivuli]ULQ56499.1 M48 family metallopeptidase [Flavihumibacter rivuli]
MQETSIQYPFQHSGPSPKIVEPSAAFRKEAIKVVGLIALFIIVYLLLVVTAFAFAAACVYGGVLMIVTVPKFLVIMIGLGVIGLGVMVFFFLVKFLFNVSRQDVSGYMEIKETDQPALFAFIREISKATNARFPKHVYLAPDVNASVFYDSGFWSMFLPVRKNLVVGLGLVNGLNRGEFSAVLAHELGHFSQRSMKLGSFVYQVNRIIFNMLYDNTGYGAFLDKWAAVSGYFAFFATITVKIVNGIQWVLRKLYGLVNKGYMGLSREMEFHADAVAAAVSGANNLESALLRLEMADSGYQSVLDTCNDWFRKNEVSQNFYPGQRLVMKELARKYQLPINNGLPLITHEVASGESATRVNFKDQWASHPPTAERIAHLHSLKMDAAIDDRSAWTIFTDELGLQRSMTAFVYSQASTGEAEQELITEKDFEGKYNALIQYYAFPEVFNGCYDGRPMSEMDLDKQMSVADEEVSVDVVKALCTNEQASILKKISGAEQDIETLQAIADGRVETSSFDFEGQRMGKGDIGKLIERLKLEAEAWRSRLQDFDERMFRNSYWLAARRGEAGKLKDQYEQYFIWRNRANEFYNHSNAMFEKLNPVYAGESLTLEHADALVSGLKTKDEPDFRQMLELFSKEGVFEESQELKSKIDRYLEASYAYFNGKEFFSNELDDILAIGRECWSALQSYIFRIYKDLLFYQASIYNSTGH